MEPKYLPPPENASSLEPAEARELLRRNAYYGTTSGFCSGYNQANLLVIPSYLADGFEQFCKVNSAPFPLLFRSQPGQCSAPQLAKDSDVKTDLPRYVVYSKGRRVDYTLDLCGFEQSWSDLVSFYLGCSFSFEAALGTIGVELPNVERQLNTSMYMTNIPLKPVGSFAGHMYTSMRPIKKSQLVDVFRLTSRYPDAHGAPIHIGDPARIGVADISVPSAGSPPILEEGDVPVFWACGFSVSEILTDVAPPLAFTHYGGSMFITDIKAEPVECVTEIDIIDMSRKDRPYFASVLETASAKILRKLEKSLLHDPGERGVIHLYQECDFLRAALTLSHANSIAITTGFPVHQELEVKEETDGLPGALSVCQALLTLGKEVVLISDSQNERLFASCVDHMTAQGALKRPVGVVTCSKATEMWEAAKPDDPPWDCMLAIERAGRSEDGRHLSMNAIPVSVDPVDDLFIAANSHPLVSTVAIGDGGNELGMGKVRDKVVGHIRRGSEIACVVPADFLIAAGVSNWAGHALSLGLYVLSSSPAHWRYRNRGIDADHTPNYDIMGFLPTNEQIGSLLKHMNDLGICDGVTGKKDQSVDGLSLQVHLDKVTELIGHLSNGEVTK